MREPLSTEEQVPDAQPVSKIESPAQSMSDDIEVPYNDYQSKHGKPYIAEHFNLGDKWDDPVGGFPKEIGVISQYIEDKIAQGEIANSVEAVKDLLKGMEKFNNLKGESRPVVKIEVLSHYVEFLQKNDQTRRNLRRYNGK